MSGEVSIDRRLSPSGRFIKDATSDRKLPIGSGSPGLIWRGKLDPTAVPVDIAGATPVNITGQGGAWALPLGYRYDTEVFLTVQGSGAPTTGDLVVEVYGSIDGGVTWTIPLLLTDIPAISLGINESRCFTFGSSVVGPTVSDITNVRTRVCRTGAAGNAVLRNDSWTKIAQYVA